MIAALNLEGRTEYRSIWADKDFLSSSISPSNWNGIHGRNGSLCRHDLCPHSPASGANFRPEESNHASVLTLWKEIEELAAHMAGADSSLRPRCIMQSSYE
jgi:hypothetical protein